MSRSSSRTWISGLGDLVGLGCFLCMMDDLRGPMERLVGGLYWVSGFGSGAGLLGMPRLRTNCVIMCVG
jgi:hypothetical protein